MRPQLSLECPFFEQPFNPLQLLIAPDRELERLPLQACVAGVQIMGAASRNVAPGGPDQFALPRSMALGQRRKSPLPTPSNRGGMSQGLTRTARTKVAQPPSGIGPKRVTGTSGTEASAVRLDRL
jgi:hypothetical protein